MKPNILVLMTDQQRWDSLHCNGNAFAITPNLDRITAGGVRFANSFTTYPLCSPARATLWTGVYPSVHKIESCVYGFDNAISEFYSGKQTVFELFKEAGYTTAYYGKWHLGCADPGFFDVWRGYNSLGMGEKDNFPGSHGEGLGLYWIDGEIGGQYKPELETDRFIDFLKSQANAELPLIAQACHSLSSLAGVLERGQQ